MLYLDEYIKSQREALRSFFSKKELRMKIARNPVTLESLIRRYHALHRQERYLHGLPSNLIIVKSKKSQLTQSNQKQ